MQKGNAIRVFIPCVLPKLSSVITNATAILKEQVFAIFHSWDRMILSAPSDTSERTHREEKANPFIPLTFASPLSALLPSKPHVLLPADLTSNPSKSFQIWNLALEFHYT